MRWWGSARCPVRDVERDWIDTSLDWLLAEFGPDRLRGAVLLPTDDFFPGAYRGTREDTRSVLGLLCAHMGIDPARIDLEHYADDADPELSAHVPLNSRSRGAAGHHRMRDGRSVIGIADEQADAPMALVATIAHELGHVLLLADGRVSARRKDHEPLTDLLTVFYGLGVFAANSAFEYAADANSYRTSRLGYLTEPMFGYALARYAWLRGEADPPWARHLDTNPRTFLRQGLRYLAR
ncbi:hypothetical protein ACIBSW_20260 [Actinoplanes sp. NPDC049668]|uniref:hypothetical protein n=1 Tax=unclassified Actinoplanes TaxID=2626549 RepID=UPI0033B3D258